MREYDIVIVGGGASGFFAAIEAARTQPSLRIIILEKQNKVLSKVAISGGGRCNVTHNCPDTGILLGGYPRGNKELRGAFSRFSSTDTVAWFAKEGVRLIAEEDGRMFPNTNRSSTIIDTLLGLIKRLGIEVITNCELSDVKQATHGFELNTRQGPFFSKKLLLAMGGGNKMAFYHLAARLGHTVVEPVPSLFTFNCPMPELHALQGVSVPAGQVRLAGGPWFAGPILITHWGLSGPAVLKASAWLARTLHEHQYTFTAEVGWLPMEFNAVFETMATLRKTRAGQQVCGMAPFDLPKRLWQWIANSFDELRWGDMSNVQLKELARQLSAMPIEVKGKSTFKDEFVTAGGVSLKEINFKTMESRITPGLYFAGEFLDIDGITGGYNFQAAWTTGWLAGRAMASL